MTAQDFKAPGFKAPGLKAPGLKAPGLKAPVTLPLTAAVFLTVALLMSALAYAGPAWAHASRIATDPAEDAVLAQQPTRVSATFSEPMQSQFAAMTLIGPDGAQWSHGETDVDGAVVSIGVRPGGPTGDYTVNYRATSADGHVVSGSWSYRLIVAGSATGGPPDEPAPSATVSAPATEPVNSDDGFPVWPFVAAASGILAAGAILAVRRTR